MQLAALEQGMLIYIGLLCVNYKVVKVRILAGLSQFCILSVLLLLYTVKDVITLHIVKK